MEQSNFLYAYLYYSSKHLSQNIVFVAFILIVEYLPIFGSAIQATMYLNRYFHRNESTSNTSQPSIFDPFYSKFSIIPSIKTLVTCTPTATPNINQCPMSYYPVAIILGLLGLLFIFLLIMSQKIRYPSQHKDKQSRLYSLKNLFLCLIFNFYDYINFRIGSICTLFFLSSYLVNSVYHELAYLLIIIALLLLSIYLSITYYYFSSVFIYAKIGFNYPFDLASTNYDRFLLLLKLIIAINLNLEHQVASSPEQLSNLIAFFSFVEIALHLVFFLVHIIKFFTIPDFVIFEINNGINIIRLFLLHYTSFCIIIFLVYFNDESIAIHIVSHIVMFFMAVILVKLFCDTKTLKIYNGSIVNQLFYLIDQYPIIMINAYDKQSNQLTPDQINSFKEFYVHINMRHLIKCKASSNECQLCLELNRQQQTNSNCITIKSIQKLFLSLYSQMPPYIEGQDWTYYYLYFITKIISSNNNYFVLNTSISQAITVFGKINNTIAANAFVFYKLRIRKLRQLVFKINMLYSFKTQSDQIKEILNIVYNTFFVQVLNPYNLVSSSVIVSSLWKSINKILNLMDNKNQYQSIIFKYILEKLFNTKIKIFDGVFDVTLYDDIITDQFFNDKHLTLNYNLSTHHITVISSGKEFIQYKAKRLEEIFIPGYAEEGINKFKANLALTESSSKDINSKVFQFPIKDFENERYMMSFQYKYMALPMVNFEECIIFGLYQLRRDNCIMTQLSRKKNEEIVLNYSYTMKKELIMPVELLEELLINKYTISLHQLFSFSTKSSADLYCLNYREYFNRIKPLLNIFTSIHGLGEQDKGKNAFYDYALAAIDKIEKCQLLKTDFKLKSKYDFIINDKAKIMIYSFDTGNNNITTCNNQINDNEYQKDQEDVSSFLLFENYKKDSLHNNESSTMGNSSSIIDRSISSGISHAKRSTINMTEELRVEYYQRKRQSRNFVLFTYIILGFNIFLICLTILFLILLIKSNNKFTSMFDFFLSWARLIRLYLTSSLSIFFNICLSQIDLKECSKSFNTYGEQFQIKNNIPLNYSLQTYFVEELRIRDNILRQYSYDLNAQIISQNEPDIIKIIEDNFTFLYLSITNDKEITIMEDKYTFMEALKIYFNLINIIVTTNGNFNQPLYIIHVMGESIDDINVDNINMDSPLSENQITKYNVILNYPRYISTFFMLNDIIHGLLLKDINSLKKVIIVFFVLLAILHLILLLISLWFSSFFRTALDTQIEEINKKLECANHKSELKEKILTLKTIALLFQENPNKSINKLEKKNTFSNQKDNTSTAANKKQSESLLSINSNKAKKKRKMYYSNIQYNKILHCSLNGLYTLFMFYFIYSIVFFIVILISLSNYSLFIVVLAQNIKIDTSVFSLAGFFQISLLTNQTQEELGKYLKNSQTNTSFAHILTTAAFDSLLEIDNKEQSSLVKTFTDFNCSTAYVIIEDQIIIDTNNAYKEKNYQIFLPLVCASFEFMNSTDLKLLVKESFYRLTLLANNVQYTYDKLYTINNSFDMFEIYVIFILIYSPLRTYETITLFSQSIKKLVNENNWIAYIYLVSNILIEFVIFILIRTYIIKKYNMIHKSMNRIQLCLKV